jgi:hypothetical protein
MSARPSFVWLRKKKKEKRFVPDIKNNRKSTQMGIGLVGIGRVY